MGAANGRTAIVVAGMHRSGTSALTRVLASLGCALPNTLMEPNEYNPAGYWESEEIAVLNDAVLESAGSTWDDWEAFNPDWYASPVAGEFRDRARRTLESEFGASRLFVLKDPRACRLLPFWIDVLTEFGAEPRIAMPIRNPLEVAESLRERDTIDPSVGLLLWLRHVLEAEAGSRQLPRTFVRFEVLLRNWQPLAEIMGRELELVWPRRSTPANLEIEDRLEPSARHHVRDDAAVLDSPEVSGWIESTFGILDRWTRGEMRESDLAALDANRSAFDEAGAAFARPIVSGMRAGQRNHELKREVTALHALVVDREGQIDSLNRAVADRDGNVAYLDGVVKAKDRELDSLGLELTERDRKIDALDHVVAGRDGEIATLKGNVDALTGTVADRDGQVDALHAVIDDRDGELAGVYASASWRLTRPLRTGKRAVLDIAGALGVGVRRAARASLRVAWRLVPLPAPARAALKRRAFRAVPRLARSELQPAAPRAYVHSGWLDLADLHYEARRNGGPIPILFDPDWYLANNPDIRTAGIDPLPHYLDHGAVEGRWPVELEPDEVDPTIEALHRLDLASAEAEAFDPAFARVLYPELATLSDAELALVCAGDGERVGSRRAFLADLCDSPREIPLDFNAPEYIRLYPDLRWLVDQSPLEALRHYMRHGRFEPRLHTLRADAGDNVGEDTPAGGGASRASGARPLCVLVHVYYPDLWEELAGYLAQLPAEQYDLYVNLVDDTFDPELLSRIRDGFPSACVYVSENVGRDVGGHFALLRNLRMTDYRVFCLLHTKKSPHMAEGEVQRWRRKLLGPLLGTAECAVENLRIVLEDDTVGLLASGGCRYTEMNANREKYDALLARLGIQEAAPDTEFVSGTMMFLRGDVLARVFDAAGDLAFEKSDARTADGDPDGAWAHAVERVFGAVVRDMNYRCEWR